MQVSSRHHRLVVLTCRCFSGTWTIMAVTSAWLGLSGVHLYGSQGKCVPLRRGDRSIRGRVAHGVPPAGALSLRRGSLRRCLFIRFLPFLDGKQLLGLDTVNTLRPQVCALV